MFRKRNQPGGPCCCPDPDIGWDDPELTVAAEEASGSNVWISAFVSTLPAPGTYFDGKRTIASSTAQFGFGGWIAPTVTTGIAEELWDNSYWFWADNHFDKTCADWPGTRASEPTSVEGWRNPVACVDESGYCIPDEDGQPQTAFIQIRGGDFLVPWKLVPNRYVTPVAARYKLILSDGCVVYGGYDYKIVIANPCGNPTVTTDSKYAWGDPPSGPRHYYDSMTPTAPTGHPAGAPDTIGMRWHTLLTNCDVSVEITSDGTGAFATQRTVNRSLVRDTSYTSAPYLFHREDNDDKTFSDLTLDFTGNPHYVGPLQPRDYRQYRYARSYNAGVWLHIGDVSYTIYGFGPILVLGNPHGGDRCFAGVGINVGQREGESAADCDGSTTPTWEAWSDNQATAFTSLLVKTGNSMTDCASADTTTVPGPGSKASHTIASYPGLCEDASGSSYDEAWVSSFTITVTP